jgi:hypothetical protein
MRGVEVSFASTPFIRKGFEIEIQILFALKKMQGGFHYESFNSSFVVIGKASL